MCCPGLYYIIFCGLETFFICYDEMCLLLKDYYNAKNNTPGQCITSNTNFLILLIGGRENILMISDIQITKALYLITTKIYSKKKYRQI